MTNEAFERMVLKIADEIYGANNPWEYEPLAAIHNAFATRIKEAVEGPLKATVDQLIHEARLNLEAYQVIQAENTKLKAELAHETRDCCGANADEIHVLKIERDALREELATAKQLAINTATGLAAATKELGALKAGEGQEPVAVAVVSEDATSQYGVSVRIGYTDYCCTLPIGNHKIYAAPTAKPGFVMVPVEPSVETRERLMKATGWSFSMTKRIYNQVIAAAQEDV